jgi:hypothetical protein
MRIRVSIMAHTIQPTELRSVLALMPLLNVLLVKVEDNANVSLAPLELYV